jgi:DNA-binding beta-propeller fold protein YncE
MDIRARSPAVQEASGKVLRSLGVLLLAGTVMLSSGTAALAGIGSYRIARADTLGGDGFWDCLTYDGAGHRLFVARQNRVMVVDSERGKLLAEIPGLDRAHGVALDYTTGRGFATSGADSSVTMFDLKTLDVLGKIPVDKDADIVIYDPASKRIFTMNGDSRTSTVIDPAAGKRIGTILLGAAPEFAVSDGSGKLYVNFEDSSAVAEIDASAMKVIRQWSLDPGNSPTGLAIDRAHHLLFSTCHNKLMVISDAVAGHVVATVPIGEGVDGCAFDPETDLAFASCGGGTGTLAIVHEDSPDRFSVVANVSTRRGARTLALDEKTHRIFTVTSDFGPAPAATKEQPRPRPSMVPGTFTLLVLVAVE